MKRENWPNKPVLGFYKKRLSNMPRVVWTEEFKTGLGFEIGPSYDDVPISNWWAIQLYYLCFYSWQAHSCICLYIGCSKSSVLYFIIYSSLMAADGPSATSTAVKLIFFLRLGFICTVCLGWTKLIFFLFSFFMPDLACYWKVWLRAFYCLKTSL